jgi:hypothetical protein
MKRWFRLPFKSFLLGGVVLFTARTVWAAACCGGASAAPAVISGDDRALITSSYSFTEVAVDNVDAHGVWHKWDQHQQVQTFRLEGAHLISDRWQAGFTLPVVKRSHVKQTHEGLGDVAASLGYEYLTDWDYNPYRPKGIGFLQLTLPTAKARAESENGGLDSEGNGFFALGVGTLLTKIVGTYDLFATLEAHRSFQKKFSNAQMSGTLKPGSGGSLGLGAGYNLKDWRFGAAVTWTYEDAVKIDGPSPSPGAVERFATGVLSLGYLIEDEWTGTLSYADQTLFGNPVNTSLGKTLSLGLQKRWAR